MLLAFVAVLPTLYWDQPPATSALLKKAGIDRISVVPNALATWRGQAGILAEEIDLKSAVVLAAPEVRYRVNLASATRSPWLETSAWRFARAPQSRYLYDAPGERAALAAAEAFMFGGKAAIRTDAAGVESLGGMLAFLRELKTVELPPLANLGVVDDGSVETAELMKLLIRRNLLFRVLRGPDSGLPLTIRLGTKEYPRSEAADPSRLVLKIRQAVSDEKRLVRLYGSEVVVVQLAGTDRQARLHLLNYAGAGRAIQGLRVRVLGSYTRGEAGVYRVPNARLMDYSAAEDSTEFTIPEVPVYAVVDLFR